MKRHSSTSGGSTVTDALTGLVWLKDADTSTIACTGGTTGCGGGGTCTAGQLTWFNAPNFPALAVYQMPE